MCISENHLWPWETSYCVRFSVLLPLITPLIGWVGLMTVHLLRDLFSQDFNRQQLIVSCQVKISEWLLLITHQCFLSFSKTLRRKAFKQFNLYITSLQVNQQFSCPHFKHLQGKFFNDRFTRNYYSVREIAIVNLIISARVIDNRSFLIVVEIIKVLFNAELLII